MTIAIYARSTNDNLPIYVEQLLDITRPEKVDVLIYKPYYDFLIKEYGFNKELPVFSNSEELISKADYVLSLGGDGTLLETKSFIRKSGIPVLGVNTGRLGFLANVNKNDLQRAVGLLLSEKFTLDKRELLEVHGCDETFGEVNFALNDFTIHKQESGSMINIDTYIDGEFLNSYYSDGLITATPTGSTAYSLSGGGPILMPDCDNFIITPIAPHNLNVRPILISNDKVITYKLSGRSERFYVTLDSVTGSVGAYHEIKIKLADFKFNLVNLEGHHFFETLRNKLYWGIDKRR
ncbi:MAG: NAD kinase [Bacteroidia bacterium]